ncbi:MAG: 4-oxalocrotonate tautomerase [Deltaproteobacteria bacterium]|nr:MAG: 4-oxalocrotonate tautomerase [Deltaproteobacteria bacterium]
MPLVRIDLIEGRSIEQKRKIVQEITETLVRVAGVKPEDVHIVIVDHPKENLASGGKLLSDLKP